MEDSGSPHLKCDFPLQSLIYGITWIHNEENVRAFVDILVSVNYRKKNSQHKIRIGQESLLIRFWSTLCSVNHISMVPTFMVSLFSSLFSFLKKLLLEHSFQTQ